MLAFSTAAELFSNDKPFVAKLNGQLVFPFIHNPSEKSLGGDFGTPTDWKDPLITDMLGQAGAWSIGTLNKHSANSTDYFNADPYPSRPTAKNWLGTDDKGRDILARLFYGSRLVLFWSAFATTVAYATGMMMGVAAGYKGGWWDEVLSFIGNVFLAFPQMVLYIVILSQLGPDSPLGEWLGSHGFDSVWVKGLTIVLAVMFATAP